jgi:hypothetical protein
MGLDRKAIRQTWILAGAAPFIGATVVVLDEGGPLWWIGLGAAGSVVSFGAAWLFLRRRYGALAAARVAAAEPVGRGPRALQDRLVLAFFRHDPASLLLDDRKPAAYAAEASRLARELPSLRSEAQARQLIYGMLVSAFESAPEPHDDSLYALAAEVWSVWRDWAASNLPRP